MAVVRRTIMSRRAFVPNGKRSKTGITGADAPPDELACDASVREHVARALARWNMEHRGSSERIARVLLLPDAPSIDANEITDKGYINQRLALERRKAEVERLFAPAPDADVLIVPARS